VDQYLRPYPHMEDIQVPDYSDHTLYPPVYCSSQYFYQSAAFFWNSNGISRRYPKVLNMGRTALVLISYRLYISYVSYIISNISHSLYIIKVTHSRQHFSIFAHNSFFAFGRIFHFKVYKLGIWDESQNFYWKVIVISIHVIISFQNLRL